MLAKQIITAVSYGQPLTLAQVFEEVGGGEIYVRTYRHTDGREWVEVQYYGGDNPVGAYFAKYSDVPVASNSDGEIRDEPVPGGAMEVRLAHV